MLWTSVAFKYKDGADLFTAGQPNYLIESNLDPAAGCRHGWESEMDEVATKIIEILKKHMKEPRDNIELSTPLTDLKIESLDLAMIVFDIEDSFQIEIPYNANEEVEDFKTVGSVVERVKNLIAAGPAGAGAAKA